VRELTGGIYFGEKRRETLPDGQEQALDACVYTSDEIARVVRAAARLARARRGKLTSVDKANVLETSRLWRSVTTRIMRDEFPDVALDHLLVDACAMHLLRRPADFDVIVTENMFGDILTDEAAMLAGSLGMLPSASLGDTARPAQNGAQGTRMGLYEPIHGSAPDIAGKGIANPVGTILSVALLLRHSLGLDAEARAVEAAVAGALDAAVDEWAKRLVDSPPIALASIKRLVRFGSSSSLADALAAEGVAQSVNFSTADTVEAFAAFLDKREPTFRGR
jgi:3-isopropylmalate dehydrogenase